MKYKITPLLGVGPINIGMPREEVRKLMSEPPKSFMKTPFSKRETDAFHESGFQVFYNEKDCVEFIELSRSSHFTVEIFNVDPFSIEADELINKISEKSKFDESNPELGYSYIFPKIELSVWRYDIEDQYFMTIGIGEKGYYSQISS